MKLTEETIIQRNPDILASDIDGEKVMMSIQQGEYYGLGKTGSFIWDHIEQPISIKELADLITEKYDINKEQCLQDILPFLNDLAEKQLIITTHL
ncbi:MAG TPA: lasso peptide biosynthesis PqqD family chaperone [Atribacterota bacterium]|nr:lasso peptide biosynthesis PqqD family chaperone [Atribacterota bacterium]